MNRIYKYLLILVAVFHYCALTGQAETDVLFKNSPFKTIAQETARRIKTGADSKADNYVTVINSGDDALLLRCHLIRNATKSINIQTFIWTNDEVGRFIMYELIEAAKRGVKVKIICDHFVSCKDQEIVAFLATVHPNLELKHYNPTAGRIKPSKLRVVMKAIFRFKGLNQRMHNKIMTFDDVASITGGRNIENSYYNRSTGMNFKDRDILVVGPVVPEIIKSFNTFWKYKYSIPSNKLKDVAAVIKKDKYKRYKNYEEFLINGICEKVEKDADKPEVIKRAFVNRLVNVAKVEFIADIPGKNKKFGMRGKGLITARLKEVCKDAKKEMIIQTPYFVMSKATRKLFAGMKKSHPDLRVIASSNSFGSTDNTMAYSANYKLRSVYLEDLAIEVHEYKPRPADYLKVFPDFKTFEKKAKSDKAGKETFICIHAKSFVIDDSVVYIGSFNLDPRSENLNTEVGLLLEDERIAAQLKDDILNDIRPANSWVIAKKNIPLSLDKVNGLAEGLMRLSPIDIWPLRNTSSFELIIGKKPVSTDHPDFYSSYKDMGSFPGATSFLSQKEITTRLYKVVGTTTLPIL